MAGDLVLLQPQQAGGSSPAEAAADAAAATGNGTQGADADAEQQQDEEAAGLDETDAADMASAATLTTRTLILQNGRLAVDGPRDAVLAHLAKAAQ